MNRVTKAAFVLLCVAAPLGAVAGQSNTDKQPSTDQQSTPKVEQTKPTEPSLEGILSVLDTLLEIQKSFPDNDLQIVIRAQVADLLWSYDERRARGLFADASLDMANATLPERSIWVAPIGPDAHYPVRSAVIPAIVRRDPAEAARLAESIAYLLRNTDPKSVQYSERSLILSHLVSLLSLREPRQSAQLGKIFAERGDLKSLDRLLSQIKRRDPRAADELFVLALEKAKPGQTTIPDIRSFASYLWPNFGEGDILHSSPAAKRDPFLVATRNPQAVPQFLEFVYEVATQGFAAVSTSDLDTYSILKLMAPYFDRFLPHKAVSFRALVEEALRRAPPEERSYAAISAPGTVQELLTRADTLTETRQKDVLYNRASAQALMSRDLDQAAAILEKIADERLRANARFNLRLRTYQYSSEETGRALGTGDFEKAEALIAGISDSELRIRLLGILITQLVSKDKARALQRLAEAEAQASDLEDGVQRTRQLMVLAGVASRIDADRGFDAMKRAVAEFNRAGFAAVWARYRATQSTTEAEKDPRLTNIGVSFLVNDCEFFDLLGSKDLNRALAVAHEIQMKEASALAQLAVCRGALKTIRDVTSSKPISPSKEP